MIRGNGSLYRVKGSTVWRGQYYVNRRRQNFSTGERDEKRARKILRRRVAEAETGQGQPEDARRLRYEDLESGLIADYGLKGRRTIRDLPRILAPLRARFRGVRALDITPVEIRAYTKARLDEGFAPATINKELSALSRMRRLAVQDDRLPQQPPVPKLPTNNARQGFLDPGDFERFVVELPLDLRPLARFAYLTGWRKGEIFGLTWRQVDLAAGTIRLERDQTKTGVARQLAFAPDHALGTLLAKQRDGRRLDCPHVFHRNGRRIRNIYGAWRKAAARAGRPGLLLHDFRRSTVRNLIRAGVPERVAMEMTGHKTRAVFDRYNIVSETDQRSASVALSEYVSGDRTLQNRYSRRSIVPLPHDRKSVTR